MNTMKSGLHEQTSEVYNAFWKIRMHTDEDG